MSNNKYDGKKRNSYIQTQQWEQMRLLNLFDSPYAKELKERISLPDIVQAENTVTSAIEKIEDSELRFALDMYIGQIAAAYEKLGFICGYKTHQTGA